MSHWILFYSASIDKHYFLRTLKCMHSHSTCASNRNLFLLTHQSVCRLASSDYTPLEIYLVRTNKCKNSRFGIRDFQFNASRHGNSWTAPMNFLRLSFLTWLIGKIFVPAVFPEIFPIFYHLFRLFNKAEKIILPLIMNFCIEMLVLFPFIREEIIVKSFLF